MAGLPLAIIIIVAYACTIHMTNPISEISGAGVQLLECTELVCMTVHVVHVLGYCSTYSTFRVTSGEPHLRD